jgi:cell division protein FtsZ
MFMRRDDICFYRFTGGDMNESDILLKNLAEIRDKKALLIGVFRFPYRFEGKKRMQTAIQQYYWMKDACDSIIFFHGEGMLHSIEANTTLIHANTIFDSYENKAIQSIEEMITKPGIMNIDVRDIKTFITGNEGVLFSHTIEGNSFDEPLKYLISAPYLPENYTDGKQMIINIGYTSEVDMGSFKNINLRLTDMFHKADLVKLGTYLMDEPGYRFKITMLVNGLDDPYPKPSHFKAYYSSSMKLKQRWELILKKGKGIKFFSSSKNAHR